MIENHYDNNDFREDPNYMSFTKQHQRYNPLHPFTLENFIT
jgi:hypothetical protein